MVQVVEVQVHHLHYQVHVFPFADVIHLCLDALKGFNSLDTFKSFAVSQHRDNECLILLIGIYLILLVLF
jgi:hypothetical protein